VNTESIPRSSLAPVALGGRVLAQDLRDADGRIVFRKGRVLRASDYDALCLAPWEELHLVRVGPDDLAEEEAGQRLAQAAGGPGTRPGAPAGGQWSLLSRHRGILEVRVAALARVNSVEGIGVYTLYDGQVVDAGETVARAKIVPFAIATAALERAESMAVEGDGLVAVRGFFPMRVAAIVSESLGAPAATRFRDALGEKVAWFGAELLAPAFVPAESAALATALLGARDMSAEIIVVAGTRAKDPLDPVYDALRRSGAQLVRVGVPAHPGSLSWLARLGDVPLLGMPSCGLFSQATIFDLLLPRILAGEDIGVAELAALGHGGFLTRDMAFRFPPYRPAKERGEVE
jgi:hypothetical protein